MLDFGRPDVKLEDLEDLCDRAEAGNRDTVQLVVPYVPTGERVRLLGTLGPYCEEIACVTDRGTVAWWSVAKVRDLVARARAALGQPRTAPRAVGLHARCKACDAPICWVKTPARNMPCDPKLVSFWAVEGGRERFVTPEGVVMAGSARQPDLFSPAPQQGYVPHWSTCTDPERFRGKRK
jgi:hypothetical protein